MGVRPEFRGQGIGRDLIDAVASWAVDVGVRALYVKTLGPTDPDPAYAQTRASYNALGLVPREETTAFWGADAPCLLSTKPVGA